MKTNKWGLLIAAATIAALPVAAQAQAQERGQWQGRRGGEMQRPSGDAPRGNWGNRGGFEQRQRGPAAKPAPQASPRNFGDRNPAADRADGRRWDNDRRGVDNNRRFDNDRRFAGGPRFDNRGQWQRNWRNDNRYDWRGWRNQNRSLFRAPRYLPPRGIGYGYRAFSPGYRLDPFFYDRSYWIADPWAYRLPAAYGSYQWVRYYDDVMLVDVTTGLVIDLIQGFFW